MRSGPIIAGMILLGFGLFLFVVSTQEIQKINSLGLAGTAARVISQDVRDYYNMNQQISLLGIVFIVAGIGAAIYGAAKK